MGPTPLSYRYARTGFCFTYIALVHLYGHNYRLVRYQVRFIPWLCVFSRKRRRLGNVFWVIFERNLYSFQCAVEGIAVGAFDLRKGFCEVLAPLCSRACANLLFIKLQGCLGIFGKCFEGGVRVRTTCRAIPISLHIIYSTVKILTCFNAAIIIISA